MGKFFIKVLHEEPISRLSLTDIKGGFSCTCDADANNSLFLRYMNDIMPFDDKCRNCKVFPICDGGCALHRYKNLFQGGNFELCTSFKDEKILRQALLTGCITQNGGIC